MGGSSVADRRFISRLMDLRLEPIDLHNTYTPYTYIGRGPSVELVFG